MAELNDLDEFVVYPIIFKYLNLDDLVNLKLVNKKFNKLINEYPIKECSFSGFRFKLNRRFTDQQWNFNYYLKSNKLNSFLTNSSLNLKWLKYLYISNATIDFKLINQLIKLEYLTLDT